MPNFARRKNNIQNLFYSKKRKLSIQQNFQRILAEEAATSANENRVNNKFPPDEPMVKHCAANEHMSERDNRNDGRGMADDPFSDSNASFVLARDDSMSSEDDDDQNDFIFDDMFGLEATDDVGWKPGKMRTKGIIITWCLRYLTWSMVTWTSIHVRVCIHTADITMRISLEDTTIGSCLNIHVSAIMLVGVNVNKRFIPWSVEEYIVLMNKDLTSRHIHVRSKNRLA
jgi:hypothetical protein